jgi:DNA oxidative demethylase
VIAPGALLLCGFALAQAAQLLHELNSVVAQAPLRHLLTPGGQRMSVAMTNCGALGWVSSRSGYAYATHDPVSKQPWPAMPPSWLALAQTAAAQAGYPHFEPDACLVNQYESGAKMSLHQDRDEADFAAPIVSVSLGLAAVFLFGGLDRKDRAQRVPLQHGDVVVWGGATRLAFHGVKPVADGTHPLLGKRRINLTFRQARRVYG